MLFRSDTPFRICYKERLSSKDSEEEEEDMIMVRMLLSLMLIMKFNFQLFWKESFSPIREESHLA